MALRRSVKNKERSLYVNGVDLKPEMRCSLIFYHPTIWCSEIYFANDFILDDLDARQTMPPLVVTPI